MLSNLSLYTAGHVVVALVAFIFHRFLRREPNLAGRRRAIFELSHRPSRIEGGEAELVAGAATMRKLDRRLEEARAALANRVQLDDPPATKWAFAWLGVILAELEAAVFFLLTAPSQLLGLDSGAWAFLAPVIAMAWVLVLHVLLGVVVCDKHRPARTVRRAKVGALVLGVTVGGALWLVLSGRTVTEIALIEELTAVGLTVLAALLSVCSAFCSIVATTLFEAQKNERELEWLETRRELQMRHIELVERDVARLRVATTPSATAGPSASAMGPAGVGLVLLLSLVNTTAPAAAQSPSGVDNTPKWTGAAAPYSQALACEFLVDVTQSTALKALQRTLDGVAKELPAIVDALSCQLLRLTPFAGDLFVSIDEVALPGLVNPAEGCGPGSAAHLSGRARAVEMLYPRIGDAHQRKASEDCIERHRIVAETAAAERRAVLAGAAARLQALGALQAKGQCTALYQAVHRGLTRSQHLVVISDALQTCAPPESAVVVSSDTRVIFLLVPPDQDEPGGAGRANRLLARLAALERAFTGSLALLGPEATSSFWRQLPRTQR